MIHERDFLAITCIKSKVGDVRDDIEAILEKCKITELLETNFIHPEQPFTPPHKAVVLWEPIGKKSHTIFMANFSDGWFTLANILGVRFKHELYRLRISDPKSEWPVWSFEYFLEGKEVRVIQVLKDDPSWEFYERGDILPFENLGYYKRRIIKERFNKDILIEYMKAVGWDLLDESFWLPSSTSYSIEYK